MKKDETADVDAGIKRISTGILGLDRVLGRNKNGVEGLHVPSFILLGGECREFVVANVLAQIDGARTLFVAMDIKIFGRIPGRDNVGDSVLVNILRGEERTVEAVMREVERDDPEVLIVDSPEDLHGFGPGSNGFVRTVQAFKRDAEDRRRATIFVVRDAKRSIQAQHEASVAMTASGANGGREIVVSCSKNRFGDVAESVCFRTGSDGLLEVAGV